MRIEGYTLIAESPGVAGGRLFRATRGGGGDEVEIRIFHADSPLADAALRARELRAGRILTGVPGVLAALDAGAGDDGSPWIAYPAFGGNPLAASSRQRLPVRPAVDIASQALAALSEAHRRDLIHLNVRRETLLFRADDAAVRLSGFWCSCTRAEIDAGGIPRGAAADPLSAPEIQAGLRTADGRADIHAIGLLLYQLLTGQSPFRDAAPARPGATVFFREVEPLENHTVSVGIPPALRRLVMQCLEPAPEDRPQDAESLLDSLRPFLDEPPATGRTTVGGDAIRTPFSTTKFEIHEELGRGAMGVVYKAFNRHLERVVAIKLASEEYGRDQKARESIIREAKMVARLEPHPNIAQVHDADLLPDGRPYVVMEFVGGGALRELMKTEAPFDEARFLRLARDICHGLEHAHRHRLVHKDVKPENILLTPDGRLKIVDFGIANEARQQTIRLTQKPMEIVGTPPYMSPEQIRGRNLTPASDVYALGCLFYEMLSGRPPFYQGEIIFQHVNEEPPPLETAFPTRNTPAIRRVVMRCLSKEPEDRYSDAGELWSALQKAAGVSESGPAPRRRAVALATVAAGLVLAVVGAMWGFRIGPFAPSPTPIGKLSELAFRISGLMDAASLPDPAVRSRLASSHAELMALPDDADRRLALRNIDRQAHDAAVKLVDEAARHAGDPASAAPDAALAARTLDAFDHLAALPGLAVGQDRALLETAAVLRVQISWTGPPPCDRPGFPGDPNTISDLAALRTATAAARTRALAVAARELGEVLAAPPAAPAGTAPHFAAELVDLDPEVGSADLRGHVARARKIGAQRAAWSSLDILARSGFPDDAETRSEAGLVRDALAPGAPPLLSGEARAVAAATIDAARARAALPLAAAEAGTLLSLLGLLESLSPDILRDRAADVAAVRDLAALAGAETALAPGNLRQLGAAAPEDEAVRDALRNLGEASRRSGGAAAQRARAVLAAVAKDLLAMAEEAGDEAAAEKLREMAARVAPEGDSIRDRLARVGRIASIVTAWRAAPPADRPGFPLDRTTIEDADALAQTLAEGGPEPVMRRVRDALNAIVTALVGAADRRPEGDPDRDRIIALASDIARRDAEVGRTHAETLDRLEKTSRLARIGAAWKPESLRERGGFPDDPATRAEIREVAAAGAEEFLRSAVGPALATASEAGKDDSQAERFLRFARALIEALPAPAAAETVSLAGALIALATRALDGEPDAGACRVALTRLQESATRLQAVRGTGAPPEAARLARDGAAAAAALGERCGPEIRGDFGRTGQQLVALAGGPGAVDAAVSRRLEALVRGRVSGDIERPVHAAATPAELHAAMKALAAGGAATDPEVLGALRTRIATLFAMPDLAVTEHGLADLLGAAALGGESTAGDATRRAEAVVRGRLTARHVTATLEGLAPDAAVKPAELPGRAVRFTPRIEPVLAGLPVAITLANGRPCAADGTSFRTACDSGDLRGDRLAWSLTVEVSLTGAEPLVLAIDVVYPGRVDLEAPEAKHVAALSSARAPKDAIESLAAVPATLRGPESKIWPALEARIDEWLGALPDLDAVAGSWTHLLVAGEAATGRREKIRSALTARLPVLLEPLIRVTAGSEGRVIPASDLDAGLDARIAVSPAPPCLEGIMLRPVRANGRPVTDAGTGEYRVRLQRSDLTGESIEIAVEIAGTLGSTTFAPMTARRSLPVAIVTSASLLAEALGAMGAAIDRRSPEPGAEVRRLADTWTSRFGAAEPAVRDALGRALARFRDVIDLELRRTGVFTALKRRSDVPRLQALVSLVDDLVLLYGHAGDARAASRTRLLGEDARRALAEAEKDTGTPPVVVETPPDRTTPPPSTRRPGERVALQGIDYIACEADGRVFLLQETEVSQADFDAWWKVEGARKFGDLPSGFTTFNRNPDGPVNLIAPAMMEAFAKAHGARLPTLAEWSAAAGGTLAGAKANVRRDIADGRAAKDADLVKRLRPVRDATYGGHGKPKAFFHLAGNVREVVTADGACAVVGGCVSEMSNFSADPVGRERGTTDRNSPCKFVGFRLARDN